MGVDYDGVGGVGIELTSDRITALVKSGVFTQDDWDDDPHECLLALCKRIGPVVYSEAGDYVYGGSRRMYLFVEGRNLVDLNMNESAFRQRLAVVGINLELSDLMVIEDLHIW